MAAEESTKNKHEICQIMCKRPCTFLNTEFGESTLLRYSFVFEPAGWPVEPSQGAPRHLDVVVAVNNSWLLVHGKDPSSIGEATEEKDWNAMEKWPLEHAQLLEAYARAYEKAQEITIGYSDFDILPALELRICQEAHAQTPTVDDFQDISWHGYVCRRSPRKYTFLQNTKKAKKSGVGRRSEFDKYMKMIRKGMSWREILREKNKKKSADEQIQERTVRRYIKDHPELLAEYRKHHSDL